MAVAVKYYIVPYLRETISLSQYIFIRPIVLCFLLKKTISNFIVSVVCVKPISIDFYSGVILLKINENTKHEILGIKVVIITSNWLSIYQNSL